MSDLSLLVARLSAAGVNRVYKVNEVPAVAQSAAYAVLGLDFGQRTSTRASGDSSGLTKRLTVQVNGPTWDAVADITARADTAFFDQTLTEISGAPFCVRELTVGPIRDPDAGTGLYALHTYRYAT